MRLAVDTSLQLRPEPTGVERVQSVLLEALPHGSSASRVMGSVAARGSVRSFRSAVCEFLDKDVAVVRKTVAELGGDLGILDSVISGGHPVRYPR